MLTLYSKFILQQGIRSPLYLMNPPVVNQEEVTIPRNTNIHYLDQTSDVMFPTRSLYYYRDVPDTKKLPVHNLTDLLEKEDVTTPNNKFLSRDIRRWSRSNIKSFRERDLFESPNQDVNMVGTFNYNTLKDLYNYRTSLMSEYSQYKNIATTFWSTVKQALASDTETHQLVPMEIPTVIPGYMTMNRILGFDEKRLIRVADDIRLLWLLDIYMWLTNDNRSRSSLGEITDEESTRVLVEFKYKGHSVFLPLHVLRGVSEESELESSLKVSNERLQKLLILLLRKTQETVTNNLNSESVEEVPEEKKEKEEVEFGDDTDGEEEEKVIQPNPISSLDPAKITQTETTTDRLKTSLAFKQGDDLEIANFVFDDDDELEKLIDETLDSDSYIDELFESKLSEVASNPTKLPNKKIPKIQDRGDMDIDLDLDNDLGEDESPLPEVDDVELDKLLKTQEPEDMVEEYIQKVIENKTHTAAEIRSLRRTQEQRKALKSPYANESIDKYTSDRHKDIELSEDLTKINVDIDILDDSLLSDKISKFDSEYVEKMMDKDVVSSVLNLEKSGLIVKDYTKEVTQNSTDKFETHKLTIRPLEGKESTVYFRIPIVDEEGTFMVSGKKYRMRKQRQPVPIVKVSPIRVALTSNYGKFFIGRTERKASDRDDYIVRFIRNDYLNDNEVITKIVPGKKKLTEPNLPNIYHTLASNFNEISTKDITLLLRQDDKDNHLDKEVVNQITRNKLTFIGYNKSKDIIVVDREDMFYNLTKDMTQLGYIEDILGLDRDKVPKPFSVMKVLGADIPLGVCLAYYLGLSGLLKVTNTKYKTIGPRERYQLAPNEFMLSFMSHRLILETDTVEKQLLFNGFLFYRDTIKQFPLRAFNNREVYLNLVEQRKAGLFHLKELDNLRELFIDPITKDVLGEMKEPVDFLPLLLRANYLLRDYQHPDVNDPNYSRIRGYDRVAGLMYRALVESVREHRLKGRSNSKISVDPYKVWNYITQDSTVKSRETLNPILTLKEDEAVTLTGVDGLSNNAVPEQLRRYHKNDAGLISESTVDSKDVAINTYLSPYAKINGLRGTVDSEDESHLEDPTKMFATSSQISPMADFDDPKRINFIGLQYSHSIPSKGYTQSPVRTGYEYILPHKVNSSFCVTAKEDGSVVNVTDKIITVKYKSGLEESYQIGTIYGEMEGSHYVHNLITDLKKGSRFKKDEALAFHEDFFERDWLDKSKLIMKTTTFAKVAIMANNEVFEDSSAVSENFAEILDTTVAEERKFILEFKQNIANILPVGTKVGPEDILFLALDETADGSNLSDQTVTLLQNLASLAPRSKMKGVIDRIEIKYNGELSDMSPSLRRLASSLDKELYERTKGTPYEAKNNKVSVEYRSDGKNLQLDTLELKIFIKIPLGLGVGDKLVFSNQMKSVIGEVFKYNLHSESGDPVDAMFSMQGMINRVAASPFIIGTTARLTRHFGKIVTDTYFKK